MGDWALSTCERLETSIATASRGAANAKGSYTQLIASTGFLYSSISFQGVANGGGGQTYLIDIAVGGAGSETVIVPNLLLDSQRAILQTMLDIDMPISIPAGTRIAFRIQEIGGAGTRDVTAALIGRTGGSNVAPASVGSAVNYGSNASTTNGILVDSGAVANTYGAWAQITASTTREHSAIHAILGTNQQTGALVDSVYYFQIGVGAGGSETILAEFESTLNSGCTAMQINDFLTMQAIPVGSRLAMRSKCVDFGTAAARHTTAIIMGY